MQLRAMKEDDIRKLKRIHERDYKNEFEFPDFEKFFLNAFIVENDDKEIITAGGLRIITEALAITNKKINVIDRASGLQDLLTAMVHTAHRDGFNEIHAFVQDEKWKKVLLHRQFKECKGQALVFQF